MITITISGFKTKEDAIKWLNAYEGGIEQNMGDYIKDEAPSCCDMNKYIPEMKKFKSNKNKKNFNLELL